MSKKVVISGYYGFGNFGDEAILSVLIKKLKSLNADITVFSSNPDFTVREHDVKSVHTFDYIKVLTNILKSNILISGGGSLLQDVTSLKSLWYYLAVIFSAVFAGKKVIIFAQGIGPINNKTAQMFTALLLKKCSYVSVRDERSHELLKKWGVTSELLCDPIYSLETPAAERQNTVGIQLREFKGVDDEFLRNLAVRTANEFKGKKVEIFSLQKSLDFEICKKFQTFLKFENSAIDTEIVEDNLIERLSSLEYLIGMRFHALLTALNAGVKCLAINYDTKVEMLAKSAGIPFLKISLNNNYEEAFIALKKLEERNLKEFAQSNKFDWANLEKEFC